MRPPRYFVLLLLLCLAQPGLSQRVVNVDKEDVSPLSGLFFVLGGQPFSLAKYVKVVEGSPFLSEEWMTGTLLLTTGKRYESLKLKIDLLADEVHYMDSAGNTLIAVNQIRELWLTDDINKKKYHFVHSSFIGTGTAATVGWHQLLVEGPAILFKKHQKEMIETKPYGSATFEQHIKNSSRFFILSNNTLTPVKTMAAVADALADKKTELVDYTNTNKLKGKNDGDYINLVSYYNSLLKK